MANAPSAFANTPPDQTNAYGPYLDPGRFAAGRLPTDDMPEMSLRAAGGAGQESDAAHERYMAARKAGTSAQENMNEARGLRPNYNAGQRYTSPDDAANYPGW